MVILNLNGSYIWEHLVSKCKGRLYVMLPCNRSLL